MPALIKIKDGAEAKMLFRGADVNGACEICGGAGVAMFEGEYWNGDKWVDIPVSNPCTCFTDTPKQRAEKLLYQSGIDDTAIDIRGAKLEEWRTNTPERDQLASMAKSLYKNIERLEGKRGLWLYGTSGKGKTFYSVAFARAFINKMVFPSEYVTGRVLSSRYLKNAVDETELERINDRLMGKGLLVIDDLGAGRFKEGGVPAEKLAALLTCFHDYKKPRGLLITSNEPPEDIISKLGNDAARVMSRLSSVVEFIELE